MAMTDEMVSAKHIAPVLKMKESVIIKYAKDGTWDQDNLGKFVISGEGPNARVKFFRKDFLQKCGFMEKDPEGPTTEQLLNTLLKHVMFIEKVMICMMDNEQRQRLQLVIVDEEKTASCGNS